MQYYSCACILEHAEPQNWFYPGGRGLFHYIWLKCLLGKVTIYSDILTFLFKNAKLSIHIKKKELTLIFNTLGQSEKGKQTSFFFKA